MPTMKSFLALCAASSASVMTRAFTPVALPQQRTFASCVTRRHRVAFASPVSVRMSDSSSGDFPSAMPEAPELTLEEKLSKSATDFIVLMESRLAEGVPEPPEVQALRDARDSNADAAVLSQRVYELMIEKGMLYDEDPEDGSLSPTQFDIKANLDVPEVQKEFSYLYRYGMNMIAQGLLDVDVAKSIIKDRLIDRTGQTPEEFDKWLGY